MNKPTTAQTPMSVEEAVASCGRIDALVEALGQTLRGSPTDIIEDLTALLYIAAVGGTSKGIDEKTMVWMLLTLIRSPRAIESVSRVITAAAIQGAQENARASS